MIFLLICIKTKTNVPSTGETALFTQRGKIVKFFISGDLSMKRGWSLVRAHVSCQAQPNDGDQHAEPDRVAASEKETLQIGPKRGEYPQRDKKGSQTRGITGLWNT